MNVKEMRGWLIENILKEAGYAPLNDMLIENEILEDLECLTNDGIGLALTSAGRVIYITHWWGSESDDILIPYIGKELCEYLSELSAERFESWKNQFLERTKTIVEGEQYLSTTKLTRVREATLELLLTSKEELKIRIAAERAMDREQDSEVTVQGVYLIRADNGLVKIGRTQNIEERLCSLKTSSPCELELIEFISTRNDVVLERLLHKKYSDKRIRRAWFELSTQDIEEIRSCSTEETLTGSKGEANKLVKKILEIT